MHSGWIDIFREVVVTVACCLRSNSSSALLVEVSQWCALDITHVRDSNNHRIIGIEVFSIELMVEGDNLRLTLIAILLLYFLQLLLHHLFTTLRVIKYFLQLCNEFHEIVILLMQLINTQTSKL